MKVDELRKIIREEVQSAIREELQEMLTEAVRVASAPEIETPQPKVRGRFDELSHMENPKRVVKEQSYNGLSDILEETRRSLTSSEARDILTNGGVTVDRGGVDTSVAESLAGDMGFMDEGIDISKLSFVKKAKDVLDLSYQKDRHRFNIQ